MRERPILFSGPMALALVAGTKTQTRRVVIPQPRADQLIPREWSRVMRHNPNAIYGDGLGWVAIAESGEEHEFRCPYGEPGDRLWVRESGSIALDKTAWMYADAGGKLGPAAAPGSESWCREFKSCPSIHMPRWASRLTLEIVSVKVERLQDISVKDAIAEGAQPITPDPIVSQVCPEDYVTGYRTLWESLNGAGSWAANPWVWVIAFRRVTP